MGLMLHQLILDLSNIDKIPFLKIIIKFIHNFFKEVVLRVLSTVLEMIVFNMIVCKLFEGFNLLHKE